MSPRPLVRPALALAGLLLLAGAARAGWWDDLDRGESVRLEDLTLQPARYQERILSFFCVFHGRDQVFQPLATPFNPERYDNVAVWPDGAAVWEEGPYKEDFPFLYVERNNPDRDRLVNLEVFTRIEVTGRIRAIYRGRPYLEVLSWRPTGHRLGRQVVQSLMAGDRYAQSGDPELAYENYVRALQPDLPTAYELLVRKRVADGLRRLGRSEEAIAMERGGILGGTGAPEEVPGTPPPRAPSGSTLGDPLPGFPDEGVPPTAAPAAPAPFAPAPVTEDLPGQPAGAGPLTDDLPGQPAGVLTGPGDLPGQPAGPVPGAGDLPGTPVAPPPSDAPPAPPPTQRPGGASAPPPAAPPRRGPRLSGVK